MRNWWLIAALCACGVNKEVHQKALDDARLRGEEMQVARTELDTVHNDLDATRAQLQSAQKDVASLRKKARVADVLRLMNLAAMHMHEAQVFSLSRTADKASGSMAVATELLGKFRDEPSLEDAPDVEKFAKRDLADVLELMGKARASFATGPKGLPAAQQQLADALAKVVAALAAQPAALETVP